MDEKRYLTFALAKGRLANKTLELLEEVGITCEEMKDKSSRKLIFVNEELKLKFFLSKGPDVPTYVEYGAADIGVVGKDTLLEEGRFRDALKKAKELRAQQIPAELIPAIPGTGSSDTGSFEKNVKIYREKSKNHMQKAFYYMPAEGGCMEELLDRN